jgi:Domain of unknown function (DUF4407)
VLRIFQTEINNQIAEIDTQRANTYLATQQRSQIAGRVSYWQSQVANLESVINSRGQTPLNFSADPQIQSLTRQLGSSLALEHTYYDQWQCQLYGIAPDGLRCKPGNGPLADNSQQSYAQTKQQVATVNSEITARKNALSSNSSTSAATRFQEAGNALPLARAELQNYRTQQDNLQTQYEATLPRNGLLIRLQALGQLSSGDATVEIARFLIFLLFLVIECLPVTVKLMQRPGNYELALEKASEYELRNVFRRIRASGGLPDATPPAPAGTPGSALDDEAYDLWQHDATMQAGTAYGRGGTMPVGTLAEFPGPATPRTRPEIDLRALGAIGPDDSPGPSGGTQLRFDDGED